MPCECIKPTASTMDAKIRNRKIVNGKIEVPLSVYMKFVDPPGVKGREVIWVEGKNNNKLRAHEGELRAVGGPGGEVRILDDLQHPPVLGAEDRQARYPAAGERRCRENFAGFLLS